MTMLVLQGSANFTLFAFSSLLFSSLLFSSLLFYSFLLQKIQFFGGVWSTQTPAFWKLVKTANNRNYNILQVFYCKLWNYIFREGKIFTNAFNQQK